MENAGAPRGPARKLNKHQRNRDNWKTRGPQGSQRQGWAQGASESVTNGKRRGSNLDQGGQRKRDKWKTPSSSSSSSSSPSSSSRSHGTQDKSANPSLFLRLTLTGGVCLLGSLTPGAICSCILSMRILNGACVYMLRDWTRRPTFLLSVFGGGTWRQDMASAWRRKSNTKLELAALTPRPRRPRRPRALVPSFHSALAPRTKGVGRSVRALAR